MVLSTIADVGFSLMKGYVLFYKILINPLVADDLISDGIGLGQICLGPEEDRSVRSLAGTCAAGGKIDDLYMSLTLAIGQHS